MQIEDAIAQLARSLVREGSATERRLVLDTAPNTSVDWAALGRPVHRDARVWLEWRAPCDPPAFLTVPLESGFGSSQLVAVGSEEWQRLVGEADSASRPTLNPIFTRHFSDADDGSIWLSVFDDDGDTGFERFADDLASLLIRIESHYSARAGSPWRLLRIEAAEDPGWQPAGAFDASELGRAAIGSMFVSTSTTTRHKKRGSVSLKVGEDRWMSTPNRSWEGGDVGPDDLDTWLGRFRSDLASGDVDVESDARQAERIEREAGKLGGSVAVGRMRVWKQPAFAALLARLDRALERFPDLRASFRPGASEAELSAAESTLGRALTPEMRALYAFADGQARDGGTRPALYWRYRFASLRECLSTREVLCGLRDTQFGGSYWDDGALPFLESGSGDSLYLDAAGAYGPSGSIVAFDHERPATREILYGSVTDWLECFVDGLESGIYVAWEGSLFPRDFAESGELSSIRRHDQIRTNGRYPWTLELALTEGS